MNAGRELPRFRELTPDEGSELLRRGRVGRIAYALHDRVDIEPIHYVMHEGWIYGRTAPGTKLERLQRNRWVAFEVDEVEELFRWRSVVVRGGFYVLTADGPVWEQEAWRTAVQQMRTLLPETLTPEDPVPFRSVLFRIAMQEVTGREATPTGGE